MLIKLTRTDQERPGQVIAIKTDSIVAIVPKWPRPEDGCVVYIGDRFTFQVEQTVEDVLDLIARDQEGFPQPYELVPTSPRKTEAEHELERRKAAGLHVAECTNGPQSEPPSPFDTSPSLHHCPKCGSNKIQIVNKLTPFDNKPDVKLVQYFVSCILCKHTGGLYDSRRVAVREWNDSEVADRPSSPDYQTEMERLIQEEEEA